MISEIITDFVTASLPVALYRRGASFNRKGRITKGPLTLMATGSIVVWPAKGPELLELTEAMRTIETISGVSQTEIYTALEPSIRDADVLHYAGAYYEVIRSAAWSIGGFWKFIASRWPHSATTAKAYYGIAPPDLVEDLDTLVDTLHLTLQNKRDLYFEELALTDECLFVIYPDSLLDPVFTVDGVVTELTVVDEFTLHDAPYTVYQSEIISSGNHWVQIE